MQMIKQVCPGSALLSLLAAISISVFATAVQSQAPVTAQPAASSEEPAETPVPKGDAVSDPQQAAGDTPPVSGTATGPIKEFKPTEKIEADSAVSFPIDI